MTEPSQSQYDCVVVGSCVIDLLCRPVNLSQPIGSGKLHRTQPLEIAAGGITCNAGIGMSRLGMRSAVFSYVGDDAWRSVLCEILQREHVDTQHLIAHPTEATSTTVVTIDPHGERSFFHCVGAPRMLDAKTLLGQIELWRSTRCVLLGYYPLMPNLQNDLADVFARLRDMGCLTAMDSAGDGGTMEPLDRILPFLDIWVPSRNEAENQTGHSDPETMIQIYRKCGAPNVVGIKLGGDEGVLLSAAKDQFIHIPSCAPPGDVVDTTGAGDSFYAGLITGLLTGLSLADAGRLGCACAACCVTAMGGNAGGRSLPQTKAIAGL